MATQAGLCDEELLGLIQLIYRAAEDGAAVWSEVLYRLANLTHASVGTLDLYDMAQKSGNITASVNVDPELINGYVSYYAAKNLWLNYEPGGVPLAKAILGHMFVPDDVLFRSEFYQDFLRHCGVFHLLGGRLVECGTQTAAVSLYRPKSAEPFSSEELAFFSALLPHLRQALQIHHRLSSAEQDRHRLVEALEKVPFGILVVDNSARVLMANGYARNLLAARDGLTDGPDGLRATIPARTAVLRNLIATAALTSSGTGASPGGTLLLERPLPKEPLSVRVAPLSPSTCLLDRYRAAAIVFVSDPSVCPTLRQLACLYKLTPAEERLTLRLVQGETLEEAAGHLQVSRNTAATQLKSVFQKTGTRRQVDLVSLLLRSVAVLDP